MDQQVVDAFDNLADSYDEWIDVMSDTPDTVAFLAERAGKGPVLELGIGTGRVAIPLGARGFEIHGIEASPRMAERLKDKAGGSDIAVVLDDFSTARLDRRFTMVYAVFNTLLSLQTQEDQVRCFQNVAEHLEPGGTFVVEVFVPDPTRYDRDGQRTATTSVDGNRVFMELSRIDPVRQRMTSQVVVLDGAGYELMDSSVRYVWPSELDLMARLAGLKPVERYADYQGGVFSATSTRHVSVYRKDDGG